MSSNVNKKAARKAKRQEEENAKRLLDEKIAAQERRDVKTRIIVAVVSVVILLVGIVGVAWYAIGQMNKGRVDTEVSLGSYRQAVEAVSSSPKNLTKEYGFLISKNGLNKPVANVPTVDVYMDFMCPGCGEFERATSKDVTKMVDAGQINVEYHFMNFLDQYSPDKYSTRTANVAIYIAENQPEKLPDFISKMMEENIQPEEGSSSVPSNKDLVKYAKSVGIKEEVAEVSIKSDYSTWLDAVTKYIPKRPSLANVSGKYKGQMTTPTVTVNKKFVDLNKASEDNISLEEALLKSLGITKKNVGKAAVIPSVGASGAPLELKK